MNGRTQMHEWMFYELMWKAHQAGRIMPLPWWAQAYFRRWTDAYDSGLFDSREAAFASNAFYRYWNMVGVKDHHQESLVGQAGEVEPVYDRYSVNFFLFDPVTRALHLPQFAGTGGIPSVAQNLENGYLPIIVTTYRSPIGVEVQEKVFATTVGVDQRSLVLIRLRAQSTGADPSSPWLCVSVSPVGPTGFQRHDKAGRYLEDRRIAFLRYLQAYHRVEVNETWGPVFDSPPTHFGLYGNRDSIDPNFYLAVNPYRDLADRASLNAVDWTTDYVAGMAMGIFAWPLNLGPDHPPFTLDVRLPIDDYRGVGDLLELRNANADTLESNNRNYWVNKLDQTGAQMSVPSRIAHLFDLYRICRGNLLMLSDNGEIHPGPTIYDSFWVRDSSVEGIACALAGDQSLAERQFGFHYRRVFNSGFERIGPVSVNGFFGSEHEKNDREWDSNGQALWAIGKYDRILGANSAFGSGMFSPYVIEGARWLRDNRSSFGLLHSGWSAEHIGDKDKPHYWDDVWALAGLWEAARLAERIHAPQISEIWQTYDQIRNATADSIRWVLSEQQARGFWETFIPTGPADVGRLDSTMIGTVAYFHPCRLYMGTKLGGDVDQAARLTLDTIWSHFMDGGLRHSAWNAYGPYLTLQLAHAFLFVGDLTKMDQCLSWTVAAAFPHVTHVDSRRLQLVLGAWNEQHCYPVAKDFAEFPGGSWYMGDIPHGWACAELMLLLRDILFFEADEDGDAHIHLAPGVLSHWLENGESVAIEQAPTLFGKPFGFRLIHDAGNKKVQIDIRQSPAEHVRYVYSCRFGNGPFSVEVNGNQQFFSQNEIHLPPGTLQAIVSYQ